MPLIYSTTILSLWRIKVRRARVIDIKINILMPYHVTYYHLNKPFRVIEPNMFESGILPKHIICINLFQIWPCDHLLIIIRSSAPASYMRNSHSLVKPVAKSRTFMHLLPCDCHSMCAHTNIDNYVNANVLKLHYTSTMPKTIKNLGLSGRTLFSSTHAFSYFEWRPN